MATLECLHSSISVVSVCDVEQLGDDSGDVLSIGTHGLKPLIVQQKVPKGIGQEELLKEEVNDIVWEEETLEVGKRIEGVEYSSDGTRNLTPILLLNLDFAMQHKSKGALQ